VTVPSVASEVQNSVSARSHLHGARNTAGSGKQSSSPFADMLDSAAPADTPAPAHVRRGHPEATDASPAAKATEGNGKDAAATKAAAGDGAKAGEVQIAQPAADTAAVSPTDAKAASDLPGPASPKDTTANTEAPPADAKVEPKSDSDDAAASATPIPDVAPPAVTTQAPAPVAPQLNPLAAATPHAEGDSDVEAAAALPAAAPQVGAKPEKTKGSDKVAAPANGTPAPTQTADDKPASARDVDGKLIPSQAANAKPAQRLAPAVKPGQGNAQAASTADAADKDSAAADDVASTPQVADGVKQQPVKGDAAPAEVHHSFAELFNKVDAGGSQAQGASSDAIGAAKMDTDASVTAGAAAAATGTGNVASVAPSVSPAAIAPQAAAVPLTGLAFEIATQASNGKNHFEIRLDPPELGRIDVKLNVDRDGNVSTHLVADRSDTLDLLKRDSASLERALQDSGLKTSDNGLQFSLRQQDSNHDETPAQNTAQVIIPEDDAAPLEALRQGYGRLLGLGGGLDIRV
jgi:flagellar hook-length control protein FliK